jgi:hypothetical protein
MARKLVIILIALGLSIPLQAQTYTKAQTEKRVLELLKKYDPSAYEIVISATNQKNNYDFSYCKGGTITASYSGSILAYVDSVENEVIFINDTGSIIFESVEDIKKLQAELNKTEYLEIVSKLNLYDYAENKVFNRSIMAFVGYLSASPRTNPLPQR